MRTQARARSNAVGRVGMLAIGLTVTLAGCGMEKVTIPDIEGPSELAIALTLRAVPDVLTADGYSTAWIEAVVHDQNGQRDQGREMLFAVTDESGNFADIGTLHNPATGARVHAATATATTDAEGVARVLYRAPPRTDATANQSIMVGARPVSDDANGQFYRSVRIELKSAEPRLFPQVSGNSSPVCSFLVEAPGNRAECTGPTSCSVVVGTDILFQSTSNDEDGVIIRYQWYWGDGTGMDDKPDTSHTYRVIGGYTVTHIVTDDDGAAASCTATLSVVNSLP